jgi:hypothetical protein
VLGSVYFVATVKPLKPALQGDRQKHVTTIFVLPRFVLISARFERWAFVYNCCLPCDLCLNGAFCGLIRVYHNKIIARFQQEKIPAGGERIVPQIHLSKQASFETNLAAQMVC